MQIENFLVWKPITYVPITYAVCAGIGYEIVRFLKLKYGEKDGDENDVLCKMWTGNATHYTISRNVHPMWV